MPLLRDCKSSKLWAIEMHLSATRKPTIGYNSTKQLLSLTLPESLASQGVGHCWPRQLTRFFLLLFFTIFHFLFFYFFILFFHFSILNFFILFPFLFFSFFIFSLLFFSSFVFSSSIYLVRTNRWEDCSLDSSRLLGGRLVLSARGVPTDPSSQLSFCFFCSSSKSICTPTYLSYYH